MLPKETETNKACGSEDGSSTDVSTVVMNSDNLMESLEQQQLTTNTDESPKLDQILMETLTAAVTSASNTSVTSSMSLGNFPNFGANGSGSAQSSTTNDPPEMPQLLNILNELLDGQDLSSLTNTGGNGDNMQDQFVDQEENYEDDSPRKEDPEELTRLLVQQRMDEISREEQQLQRKMDFLIRRLYKLVARSTGLHVSEEIAGFLEHVARHNKKKEKELKEAIMGSKFPCLTANLQGTSQQTMIAPLTPTNLPPINLLSSPSAHQQQQQENTTIITTNIPSATTTNETDVIEIKPAEIERLRPVPLNEMKTFLRRIENISTTQHTMLNKRAHSLKYFAKSTTLNASANALINQHETNLNNSIIARFEDVDIEQLENISGLLMSEMRLIEKQIDSDATASSSGGESADEMIQYNNQYQQPLSIAKRAAYKFSKDRGAVASRWCWLATQISELDYKIRQHTDLRKHIKDSKGIVTLDVTGFEGQLPGSSGGGFVYNLDSDSDGEGGEGSAARVRPLNRASFRKRKLVQTTNLHQTSKKANRPSTLKCGCQWPLQPCALCTARVDPTAPRELSDTLPAAERVALIDPGFHPVLSFPDDVSSNIHLEAIMNIPEWQAKMIRSSPKSIMKLANKHQQEIGCFGGGNGTFKEDVKHLAVARSLHIEGKKPPKGKIDPLTGKRKYTKRFLKLEGILTNKIKERKKHKKRRNSLTGLTGSSTGPRKYTFKKRMRKIQFSDPISSNSLQNSYPHVPNGLNGGTDKHFEPINRSKNSSPVPNHRPEKTQSDPRRSRNYDIDNIVIPYSVAAATRVELLTYKEIPTPKWRVVTDDEEIEQMLVEQQKCNQIGKYQEKEDISDESLCMKHEKALLDERRKFETYLKFPLTSRSRANRRIDSRGNESSGANTPDPTSPAPALSAGDLESIPSPLDGQELQETPSISALHYAFNGRKERRRTMSKKDVIDWNAAEQSGGGASGAASRCISPEPIKETIPAYEPLNFPLTDPSLQKMKRIMPMEHLKQVEKYFNMPSMQDESTSHQVMVVKRQHQLQQQHPKRPRKHNDSISESKLIKEKLPSSSLATIGKNNNVLIPRNNHNLLENIDLTGADGAVLKKLMNNNNGDLNGEDGDGLYDNEMGDDSDSETVTGDESLFEPESEDEQSDDFMLDNDDDDDDYDQKQELKKPYKKPATTVKRNSLITNVRVNQ